MSIAGNLARIEERIQKACARCGRKRGDITLMGVTKFHPVESVRQAFDAGLRCFGESRVQEAVEKFDGFAGRQDIELHLIGSLQRNKAKSAALFFDCIQSIDRRELIIELEKHAAARVQPLPVLLELRTGEESKSGFTGLDELFRSAELLLSCRRLRACGLMTIAPFTSEKAPIRAAFRRLVEAQGELKKRFPVSANAGGWDCLSMGMSGDFEIACEEGSTLLRIGEAIFGEREKK